MNSAILRKTVHVVVLISTILTVSWCEASELFRVKTWEQTGPVVEPWVTLTPADGFHGQWLVAGDLNSDGKADIITARNERQAVTAAVATTLDGETLWTWGKAGAGSHVLNYDVPLQIHDIDRDGKAEVYLSTEGFLVVLDGATGTEIRRHKLPVDLKVADCITFADLSGCGYPTDIIVKTRYTKVWAFSKEWKQRWHWCAPEGYKTCHHPTLIDIDHDGRDEVLAGYTLLDDDGSELWTLSDDRVDLARGHLDVCEVYKKADKPADWRLVVTCCAASRIAMIDGRGQTQWDMVGHHFESIDSGRIRDDVPGPQIVTDIDHLPYREAMVWMLDADGRHIGTFECGYGRHHRLIDWNGDGLDDVLIGHTRRIFDGRGRCIAMLGPTGSFETGSEEGDKSVPGPFAVIGDLDGDGRPEIVLHYNKLVRIYRSREAGKRKSRHIGTGLNFTLY